MKIANIPIGKCRDEVTALKAQIEIIADQVKDQITKLCQDLEWQRTIMNSQVIGSTTNIDLQNLQKRVKSIMAADCLNAYPNYNQPFEINTNKATISWKQQLFRMEDL